VKSVFVKIAPGIAKRVHVPAIVLMGFVRCGEIMLPKLYTLVVPAPGDDVIEREWMQGSGKKIKSDRTTTAASLSAKPGEMIGCVNVLANDVRKTEVAITVTDKTPDFVDKSIK
jgi:hypothetical protein